MSFLRERVRAVLQTFDSLSRQKGFVEKEELLTVLSGKVDADEAEEIIDKLLQEGLVCSPSRRPRKNITHQLSLPLGPQTRILKQICVRFCRFVD